jgi:hypothetical protein
VTKFVQEISEFRTAIELYRSGNNGNYPPTISDGGTDAQDTVAFLQNLGLFGSSQINLPPEINYLEFYSTGANYFVTCGSPDSSGNSWAIAFDHTGLNGLTVPGFSDFYSGGMEITNYSCVEI